MRLSATVPFAAVAAAIVIPDLSSWADVIPSQDEVRKSVGGFVSDVKGNLDSLASGFEDVITSAGDALESAFQDEASLFGGHHGHHGKGENRTIYELIKENDYTSKFAAIVDEHESIVKLLNSTKANYTLFVPINAAFEHIPDHPDHKPSKEFVEALLKYHVGVGLYPAGRILATHTLPTALDEDELGGEPQRLRVRVGLTGVRVNFYDKVVGADYFAKNGVIHAVRNILVPPPRVGRLLSLFPSKFSTLLLAMEKTNFVDFIHSVPLGTGSTVFAPSNTAFDRLGPGANAFLFNSEKGLKYLKALLKYHIVVNETLYSDALYIDKSEGKSAPVDILTDGEAETEGVRHYHVDLPSLLKEKNISVDITRWGGFIDVKVNGYVHVAVQDGIARNGAVQVVDHVLLPHRNPGKSATQGEVDVEELKQILEPFIEESDESTNEEWSDL